MRIAIMPARGGSTRIPHKNIVDFFGRPLLTYALETARASQLFDVIHVSTEDERTAEIAAQWGFPAEFLRDAALADDRTPLMPVMKWVLERFAQRGRRFDTVCLLMPAAPLILPEDLVGACRLYESQADGRGVLAVTTMPCPVEWAMRLLPDGSLVPIEPDKAELRSQDLPKAYIDSGTFAFCSAAQVMAYPGERIAWTGYVLPRHRAVDIDEPEDLDMAEHLFRGRRR